MKHIFPASDNGNLFNHKRIEKTTKFGFVVDGLERIDLGCNMSATVIGFDRHDIIDHVAEQLKRTPLCPSEYEIDSPPIADLSERIFSATGCHSFFSLSGSDSIEMAIRCVTKYHYRNGNKHKRSIVGFRGSYHGSNLLNYRIANANPATGAPAGKQDGFIHLPNVDAYDTTEQFEQETLDVLQSLFTARNDIGCVVQESCSWGGRLKTLSVGYWNKLQSLCSSFDVLLVVDDVAMSGGKTGSLYGFDLAVVPDIFCVGKAFGGGYFPLAVTCIQPHINDVISNHPFCGGYTHSFHMPGIIAANYYHRVLLDEGIMIRSADVVSTARDVCEMLDIKTYSNHGNMFALTLHDKVNTKQLERTLFDSGLNLGFVVSLPVTDLMIWCVPLVADEYYFERVSRGLARTLHEKQIK